MNNLKHKKKYLLFRLKNLQNNQTLFYKKSNGLFLNLLHKNMPGGNQTPDLELRKLTLYSTELRAHK